MVSNTTMLVVLSYKDKVTITPTDIAVIVGISLLCVLFLVVREIIKDKRKK